MYYPDLQSYSYSLPFSVHSVLTVGWLDGAHPFTLGRVGTHLVEKLKTMAIEQPAQQTRGFSSCEICGLEHVLVEHRGVERRLGSAELWIPDAVVPGSAFAAPDMVIHYIVDHGYLPPEVFLKSLRIVDSTQWNGAVESERIIESSFHAAR